MCETLLTFSEKIKKNGGIKACRTGERGWDETLGDNNGALSQELSGW